MPFVQTLLLIYSWCLLRRRIDSCMIKLWLRFSSIIMATFQTQIRLMGAGGWWGYLEEEYNNGQCLFRLFQNTIFKCAVVAVYSKYSQVTPYQNVGQSKRQIFYGFLKLGAFKE